MFGAMFAWLTDVSAFHSQPWWLPRLHPGFSTSSKFLFLGSKWLTGWHQGLNSNLGFKMSLQKLMADATETTDVCFYSLWSSFDVKGYTEKTSVTRSESPETICFHVYRLYLPLGLYVEDWLFKGVTSPNFNSFKFSSCNESNVIACICLLLFRQSCHVIVDTDKRQRLYLLEVAAWMP